MIIGIYVIRLRFVVLEYIGWQCRLVRVLACGRAASLINMILSSHKLVIKRLINIGFLNNL